jgi:tetratricopeptide (TPR) repeat protein
MRLVGSTNQCQKRGGRQRKCADEFRPVVETAAAVDAENGGRITSSVTVRGDRRSVRLRLKTRMAAVMLLCVVAALGNEPTTSCSADDPAATKTTSSDAIGGNEMRFPNDDAKDQRPSDRAISENALRIDGSSNSASRSEAPLRKDDGKDRDAADAADNSPGLAKPELYQQRIRTKTTVLTLEPLPSDYDQGDEQTGSWIGTFRFDLPPPPLTRQDERDGGGADGEGDDLAATNTLAFDRCADVVVAAPGEGRRTTQRVCARGTIEITADSSLATSDPVLAKKEEEEEPRSLTPELSSPSSLAGIPRSKDAHQTLEATVRVGEIAYRPPYDQHGSAALRDLLLEYRTDFYPFEEAEWLVALGDLYRTNLQYPADDDDAPVESSYRRVSTTFRPTSMSSSSTHFTSSSPQNIQPQHVEHAANAYKHAVRILQRLLGEPARDSGIPRGDQDTSRSRVPTDPDELALDAQFLLASAYFSLSELYASASASSTASSTAPAYVVPDGHNHQGDKGGEAAASRAFRDRVKYHPLTVSYMKLAEKTYRKILLQHSGDGVDDSLLDPVSRHTALMTRAACCVRLGVLLLEDPELDAATSATGLFVADRTSSTVEQAMAQPPAIESNDELADTRRYYQKLVDHAELAIGYFSEAAVIYHEMLHGRSFSTSSSFEKTRSTRGGRPDRRTLQYDYALVLHNLATASTYRTQDYESILNYAKKAINYYQAALDQHQAPGPGRHEDERTTILDIQSAVGDLMFTSSDSLLRLGRYEESKAMYRKCIQWHEQHRLPPPPALKTASSGSMRDDASSRDEAIQEYEQILEEYREAMAGSSGVPYEGADEEELPYSVDNRQDGYEGDLHMNLGSLYMANGDTFAAISHLQQAMQLYERSDEKGDDSNAADVKFTLSELHFRNGDYQASMQLHEQALDLYRRAHGDGVNPIEDAVPKVEPTVKFQLDRIDELTMIKNLAASAKAGSSSRVSNVETTGKNLAPARTGTSSKASKSEGNYKVGSVDEEPKRRSSDDPVHVLMDYWYAELAKEIDGEKQDKHKATDAPKTDEL